MLKLVANPPNPFNTKHIEWIDCEPPAAKLEVYKERAKSILSTNKSPDLGFKYSINPYRGCFHACAYCYARPTHQYLDYGAGSDFERKLVVKHNAAELLETAFNKPSWQGDLLVFSGVTDCYQPLEASYELTRRCLQVCTRYRNPVSIITKGALVSRDIDVLQGLNEVTHVHVIFSIAFADDTVSKLLEPHAPRPSTRFRAMAALRDAGISVGIATSPMIPGLNESDLPTLLSRAAEHGACSAFMTLLRLPAEVEEVFVARLKEAFPERAKKVLNGIREMKGGVLNRSRFGSRLTGEGSRWEALEWLFRSHCKKLGLEAYKEERVCVDQRPDRLNTFRRPVAQLDLF